jgi:uncharacterized heparinase superfamily protein
MTETAPAPAAPVTSRWARRWARAMDGLHARLAGLGRGATAFVSQPEPRTVGSLARGTQLLAGNFMFEGHLVEAPGSSIWDIAAPDAAFEEALHGFAWLDDLAAVGDAPARAGAQLWLGQWIRRFGRGRGPGWAPETAGRRVIRWINHALFLLNGQDSAASRAYFAALGRQTVHLSRRWRAAPAGLPRFEALTGLVYAGLALEGMGRLAEPARRALAAECGRCIDAGGAIPTRNPEELLEVFTLLTWAAAALAESGGTPLPAHLAAIERIAPTLRALRHADGGLARFHGGGRGQEGLLDHALATAGIRTGPAAGLAMGYARLSAGRTSVIVDAARPPAMAHSGSAHASTLAFELTSGRRPLIVSCGAGSVFGEAWRRAGRATPSHSTAVIDGYSSSRLGPRGQVGRRLRELLVHSPDEVRVQQSAGPEGLSLLASHNGYVATHGLTHVRRLDLSLDGRALQGDDTLGALSEDDRIRFERLLDQSGEAGVRYAVRFHLHPEVEAELDMGGTAVSLALKSGEIWVFRQDGAATLTLEPSVYLEKGRLKPRATKQVVLSAVVMDYAGQVGWSLAKAQETPLHLRDLERDEEPAR